MPAIRALFDLQAVDMEIDRRRRRLREIAGHLGNEGPLPALRSEEAGLRESTQKIGARQRELDSVVDGLSEKIRAAESKLYSGTITSSRELTDLQADVDQLKRQRSDQEGHLLAVIDELEVEQARLDETARQLEQAESTWRAEQASLAEEQGILEAEVTDLSKDRERRAGSIPPAELALYDQVRQGHRGKAVALVRNGTCLSCRVALPTRQAASIKAAAAPVRCPNCGLILLAE